MSVKMSIAAVVLAWAGSAHATTAVVPPPVVMQSPASTPAHTALVKKLMDVTGTAKRFDDLMPKMIAIMLPIFLHGNEAHQTEVQKILTEEFTTAMLSSRDKFVSVTGDVYEKNFSDQELSDLIAFYQSPTGQKLIEKLPVIMTESMQAGAIIGRKAGMDAVPRIIERLKKAQLKVPQNT